MSFLKGKRYLFKIFRILGFLLLVTVPVSLILFLSQLIRIKEISCQSQYGPCHPQVQETLKRAENLDLASAKKVLKLVLSDSVLVKDYSLQFKLPNILRVNLIEKKPKFAMSNEAKSSFVLVDEEGEVIFVSRISNLPNLVTKEELPKVGEKVTPETLFALEIISGISPYYPVLAATLEKENLVVDLTDAPSLIFPLKGDKEVLMGAANLLLTRLKSGSENSKIENGPEIKLIDLRFKNPVLK